MKIEMTLSPASIAAAAQQLRAYAASLQGKTGRLVQKLGEKGAASADLYLEHDDTGGTRSSIAFTRQGTSGTVSVGGAAVWIEFGTGVLANAGNSPHPKRDEAGAVPWGEYGNGNGKGVWYFPSHYSGWTATKGIPMNPFMYAASQDMRRSLLDLAREAFHVD